MKQNVQGRWSAVALLAWLALGNAAAARADVGPIDPARQVCMGSSAGAPCTYQGKEGTCQGPHPSRMYCTPGPSKKPEPPVTPKPKPAEVVDAPVAPKPKPAEVVDAPIAPPPAAVKPAPVTPAPIAPPAKKKSGCSVSSSEQLPNALFVLGAIGFVGLRSTRGRANSKQRVKR